MPYSRSFFRDSWTPFSYCLKVAEGDSFGPTFSNMNQASHSPAVLLKKVTKSFGLVRAVDDLSLEVPRVSINGFIGPNTADVFRRAEKQYRAASNKIASQLEPEAERKQKNQQEKGGQGVLNLE
jgi:hypothetical protein